MRLSAPIFRLKRQAKMMSRHDAIPLHEAQDRLARNEGFQRWSHLAAHHQATTLGTQILDQLEPGDLVLLAGVREQGKTTIAFQLVADAVRTGRSSVYFSLDENGSDIERRLDQVDADLAAVRARFSYDTSEEISARYIVEQSVGLSAGSIVVVDYLQMLDQQRTKPILGEQIDTLRTFAGESESIVVVLSQIDRAFGRSDKAVPDLDDIRLPNPVDLTLFTKACFVHDGNVNVLVSA